MGAGAAAASLLLLLALPARAAEPWRDSYSNPKPADGDVVLPMPCGGAMVFRRVDTPASGNWLDDARVMLGQPDEETAYAEYLRSEHIAGSLSDPGGARYFLIGKYEVTRDQFDAVTRAECPKPSNRGRTPATGIGWFDAVAYSRAYTEWLLGNAADRLPREGDRRAFLRLPTETEWEYAARGGARVGADEFRASVFPMDDELPKFVWFQGPSSSNNRLQLAGLLKPNPLGLHDMLGNAEEMVLEPYRMNRAGRLHGQQGGIVAKGGSFLTGREQIRTAARIEYPPFDEAKGTATALDHLGFRLVVAAPVNVSLPRIDAYRRDWGKAAETRVDPGGFDPVAQLEGLARDTADIRLQATLKEITARFRSEIQRRNEIDARALQSALYAGAVLVRKIRDDTRRVRQQESIEATIADMLKSAEARVKAGQQPIDKPEDVARDLGNARRNLEVSRTALDLTVAAYVDVLIQIADDYPAAMHEAQLAVLRKRLEETGVPTFIPFAERAAAQARGYQRTGAIDRRKLLDEITTN